MIDINKYYDSCSADDFVDNNEFYQYLKSFKDIILWGASFTGLAIGKKLRSQGINFTEYWDLRAEDLYTILDKRVSVPFSTDYNREKTTVIICIPNHVIMPQVIQELQMNGYYNYLRGDIIYSGICCKLNKRTGLSAKHCWSSRECRSVICKRARNILMSNFSHSKDGERIDFLYGVFIITTKCNLRCKYCVQFIPNYDIKKMTNIPFESIKRDINKYLSMIDTVGTISVMGGETFLHPDLGEIAREFCKYDNFGFISFPTNGLVPILEKQLVGMQDKRVVIPFGAYKHIANEKQKEIYACNIELIKKSGVVFVESNPIPAWLDSKRLVKFTDSIDYMISRKKSCKSPPRNLQVRDGKIHVCDRSVALHAMGVVDYPTDYFDLTEDNSIGETRNKFRDFFNRNFYYTCSHCPRDMKDRVPVAEQGAIEAFRPYDIEYVEKILANAKIG